MKMRLKSMMTGLLGMLKEKRTWVIIGFLILQAVLCVVSFEWLATGSLKAVGSWIIGHPFYFMYTVGLVLWLLSIGYAITHDLRWGYIVVQILMMICGVVESIKIELRKEYLELADFMVAGEGMDAASDVEFTEWTGLIITIVGVVAIMILECCTKKYWKRKRTKRILLHDFLLSGLIFLFMLVGVVVPSTLSGAARYVISGAQGEVTGGLVCFVESVAYYTIANEYNDDIYEEAMEAFLEDEAVKSGEIKLATKESVEEIEVKPNIIAIMSETLWDANQLSDIVTYSENPMQVFDTVAEEFAGGRLACNVFGGGTDKSEYEFLTGWNSKYLTERSAYRAFFNEEQASLVQYLEELGYVSHAIHPYEPNFWNRDVAYANMGFDAFYDMYTMDNQEKYDVFVSDSSITKEIIQRYEERKAQSDAPIFSFAVTIANHVTKIVEGEAAPICTDIKLDYQVDPNQFKGKSRLQLAEYVNGVYTSGKALQELIDYFEQVEEPTIIVLFGDHAPSFVSDFETQLDEETIKEDFYYTPFLVWNNYGLEDKNFGEDACNISYLSELLLEYLDFPLPKQAVLTRYLRLQSPVDTRFMVKDYKGNDISLDLQSYLDRSYAVHNAMHYHMLRKSDDLNIWSIMDTDDNP